MGLITSQCCANKNNDNINKSVNSFIKRDSRNNSNSNSQKDDSPNSNDSNCSPKQYFANLLSQPKRVLFSNFINQRIFSDNFKINDKFEVEVVETYNDVELYIPEKEEEITHTNISFEETNNRLLIEDGFYKIKYQLQNTFEQIQSNFSTIEAKQQIKNHIKLAIMECKNRLNNNIHRIDGILLINSNIQMIVLTEKNLFEFYYNKDEDKYKLTNEIKISYIDFISLSSDYTTMILHFSPSIGLKNLTIIHEELNNLAACICSSNLCDIVDYDNISNTRKISIILFNKLFDITEELTKCTKFGEYINIMNSFLNEKLKLTFLSSDFDFFKYKYCSVRIKIHSKFSILDAEKGFIGDIIITNEEFYILKYVNCEFEIINKIPYKTLTKLALCHDKHSFLISDNENLGNYEIISESFSSIYNLIKSFQ